MSSYVWIKHKRSGDRVNEPSYCDRVLWRSYPGTKIVNTSYGVYSIAFSILSLSLFSPGCTNNITTSDHSPVFSTFQIGGVKQFTSGLLVYLYCTLIFLSSFVQPMLRLLTLIPSLL